MENPLQAITNKSLHALSLIEIVYNLYYYYYLVKYKYKDVGYPLVKPQKWLG